MLAKKRNQRNKYFHHHLSVHRAASGDIKIFNYSLIGFLCPSYSKDLFASGKLIFYQTYRHLSQAGGIQVEQDPIALCRHISLISKLQNLLGADFSEASIEGNKEKSGDSSQAKVKIPTH